MPHISIILDKAVNAKTRIDRTVTALQAIEQLEKNEQLTPELEEALEPHLETLETVSTPSDYSSIDAALAAVENLI